MARTAGVNISFVSWIVASSVPTLTAMLLLPWLLQRIIKPEVTSTPEAPAAAKRALAALGPLSRAERIVAATFVGMVALWASASALDLDPTAIALLGLGVLLATGVLTAGDIAKEGDVLSTFIWFAVLFALSGQLNEMGFMGFLGQRLANALGGFGPLPVYLILIITYVLFHYMFVSQTAHVLALFAVFLDVGVTLGVPAAPLAFMLLFAHNLFSVITPQAASANLLFTGSGYLTQGELYRFGAITTAITVTIYLLVATPWLMWVAR
jgi:DASS family divalent anion:Na+ symporter